MQYKGKKPLKHKDGILKVLEEKPLSWLSFTDILNKTGIPKGSLHYTLTALRKIEELQYNEDMRRYASKCFDMESHKEPSKIADIIIAFRFYNARNPTPEEIRGWAYATYGEKFDESEVEMLAHKAASFLDEKDQQAWRRPTYEETLFGRVLIYALWRLSSMKIGDTIKEHHLGSNVLDEDTAKKYDEVFKGYDKVLKEIEEGGKISRSTMIFLREEMSYYKKKEKYYPFPLLLLGRVLTYALCRLSSMKLGDTIREHHLGSNVLGEDTAEKYDEVFKWYDKMLKEIEEWGKISPSTKIFLEKEMSYYEEKENYYPFLLLFDCSKLFKKGRMDGSITLSEVPSIPYPEGLSKLFTKDDSITLLEVFRLLSSQTE